MPYRALAIADGGNERYATQGVQRYRRDVRPACHETGAVDRWTDACARRVHPHNFFHHAPTRTGRYHTTAIGSSATNRGHHSNLTACLHAIKLIPAGPVPPHGSARRNWATSAARTCPRIWIPPWTAKEVVVMGWVAAVRSHGNITFATIRDRAGPVQIVAKKGACDDDYSLHAHQGKAALIGRRPGPGIRVGAGAGRESRSYRTR